MMHGIAAVVLGARLQALDDTRSLAELMYKRTGRVYTEEIHEERKARVRARIAEQEALAPPGEYP